MPPEIVGPPPSQPFVQIEEPLLKNRKSYLRRGCGLLVGCLFFILLISAGLSWLPASPAPEKIASLPLNFPTNIPLYKFEERATVAYLAGEKKDTLPKRTALFPRLFFYPLIKIMKGNDYAPPQNINGPVKISIKNFFGDVKKILRTPLSDRRVDSVIVLWENLNEETQDILDFYRKNLLSQNFSIKPPFKTGEQLSFDFQDEISRGRLIIEKSAHNGQNGQDVILEIDYLKNRPTGP